MDKKKIIKDLMKPYFDNNRNTYQELSLDEIKQMETKYGLTLPDSFKWFLTEYYFEGMSVEIPAKAIRTGINCLDKLNINYKDNNYPEKLFIISHVDEYDYCLDTIRMKNGECPVVSFSIYDKDGIIDKYYNFYDFLIDQINNSIDNDFFEQ